MPIVYAYQHPKTQKLYATKEVYVKHLKVQARRNLNRKAAQKIYRERQALFAHMRATVRDTQELEQFVKDNWKVFVANGFYRRIYYNPQERMEEFLDVTIPTDLKIRIKLNPLQYISEGLDVPIGQERTNPPSKYEGWIARIEYTFKGDFDGRSSIFHETGMHIHSGRGNMRGDGTYSWLGHVVLWASDWPELKKTDDMQAVMKRLNTEPGTDVLAF